MAREFEHRFFDRATGPLLGCVQSWCALPVCYAQPSYGGEDCALRSFVASIRREYLDRAAYWSARDLKRKLALFKEYYNSERVHRGLDGAPPDEKSANTNRKIARLDAYRWQKR
ncbi:MAG: hypothetical protein E2O53_09100 [Gammaproteobacteria bacterium]|nr:MAG: hypothetical protein E2O53_09100 [Gammaproteobacteria bacterium]